MWGLFVTHELWILVVPGSHFEGGFSSWRCVLSLNITALKCFFLSYQQARATRHKRLYWVPVCVLQVGEKSKILFRMCVYAYLCVAQSPTEWKENGVCVFVLSSHRASVLSQNTALFWVCASIQPRKLFALQINIYSSPSPSAPSYILYGVCAGKYRKVIILHINKTVWV